jgi:hypothetical protein
MTAQRNHGFIDNLPQATPDYPGKQHGDERDL